MCQGKKKEFPEGALQDLLEVEMEETVSLSFPK
jgi:hypothetical protein